MSMICALCQEKIKEVDYKQTDVLRKFVSSQFKLLPSKRTGTCDKHQRLIAHAVKRARFMALMPYTKHQTRQK